MFPTDIVIVCGISPTLVQMLGIFSTFDTPFNKKRNIIILESLGFITYFPISECCYQYGRFPGNTSRLIRYISSLLKCNFLKLFWKSRIVRLNNKINDWVNQLPECMHAVMAGLNAKAIWNYSVRHCSSVMASDNTLFSIC